MAPPKRLRPFVEESGRFALAEALFDAHKRQIHCSECPGNHGQPGHIKDQAGRGGPNGESRRYWFCQRANGNRKEGTCRRVSCAGYIDLARAQLSKDDFDAVVAAVCKLYDSKDDRYAALSVYLPRDFAVVPVVTSSMARCFSDEPILISSSEPIPPEPVLVSSSEAPPDPHPRCVTPPRPHPHPHPPAPRHLGKRPRVGSPTFPGNDEPPRDVVDSKREAKRLRYMVSSPTPPLAPAVRRDTPPSTPLTTLNPLVRLVDRIFDMAEVWALERPRLNRLLGSPELGSSQTTTDTTLDLAVDDANGNLPLRVRQALGIRSLNLGSPRLEDTPTPPTYQPSSSLRPFSNPDLKSSSLGLSSSASSITRPSSSTPKDPKARSPVVPRVDRCKELVRRWRSLGTELDRAALREEVRRLNLTTMFQGMLRSTRLANPSIKARPGPQTLRANPKTEPQRSDLK